MLELYVLLTLGALGYLINQTSEDARPLGVSAPSVKTRRERNEISSVRNVYESRYSKVADATTRRAARVKFADAENTARDASKGHRTLQGAVVSDAYHLTPKPVDSVVGNPSSSKIISSLTGNVMRADQFFHENPTPFFGSRIRQNMDDRANATLLETFTGVSDLHCDKRETKSFYDGTAGQSFVNGAPLYNQFYQSRIVDPKARNNVLPFEQQRVGPGLGQGYGTTPTGGFQQFDNFAREKSVDELRTQRNPDTSKNVLGIADRSRATYEGRTLPGLKTGLRGDTGTVAPPKVDNTRETGDPTHWLRTTGAVTAPTNLSGYAPRETQRRTTTACSESIGPAFAKDSQARTADPDVSLPRARGAPCRPGPEPGVAAMSRFGRGSIYDHGKDAIELYANQRDVTGSRPQTGRNVGSLVKAIVAPLQDVMRLTRKNWSDPHPRSFGMVQVQIPDKQTVYDPTDVARTTIKETLIHDDHSAGGVAGPVKPYVYDPDVVARLTVRETLDAIDPNRNVGGASKITRRPDSAAPNTTVKETTVDKARIYGNVDAREGGGGYETNDVEAKTTMRELWADDDEHYGAAARESGKGYLTNEMDAKTTQKEGLTANSEHYGGSEAVTKAPAAVDYVLENATVSDMKEAVLDERAPTDTRERLFNAEISVAVPRKNACESTTSGVERVVSVIPSCTTTHNVCTITRPRQADVDDAVQRLDPSVLGALKTNPFALPALQRR